MFFSSFALWEREGGREREREINFNCGRIFFPSSIKSERERKEGGRDNERGGRERNDFGN